MNCHDETIGLICGREVYVEANGWPWVAMDGLEERLTVGGVRGSDDLQDSSSILDVEQLLVSGIGQHCLGVLIERPEDLAMAGEQPGRRLGCGLHGIKRSAECGIEPCFRSVDGRITRPGEPFDDQQRASAIGVEAARHRHTRSSPFVTDRAGAGVGGRVCGRPQADGSELSSASTDGHGPA